MPTFSFFISVCMALFDCTSSIEKNFIRMVNGSLYQFSLCCFVIHLCSGFPVWLRDIPGIEFRTDNEPYKVEQLPFINVVWESDEHYSLFSVDPLIHRMFLQAEMQTFVTKIVNIMKEEKLYSWQGGPIILQQVRELFLNLTDWCFSFSSFFYSNWLVLLIILRMLHYIHSVFTKNLTKY